jgi:hypothetical protein
LQKTLETALNGILEEEMRVLFLQMKLRLGKLYLDIANNGCMINR